MNIFNKIELLGFCVEKRIRCKVGKAKGINKIMGRDIVTITEGNEYLKKAIHNGVPFMAARYGSTEMQLVNRYLLKCSKIVKEYKETNRSAICVNSGFFPERNDLLLDRFAEEMLAASKEVDVLGLLNSFDEGWVIKKYIPEFSQITYLRGLEPYYHEMPWSFELKGKRIVIVHPFKETILSQYRKRELLFKDKDILPEFDLSVVKAVQSIAGEKTKFETWFDALDYMAEEVLTQEFDIALLGCGAYGFPLAARIKKAGKIAIHMGGGITDFIWDKRRKVGFASIYLEFI